MKSKLTLIALALILFNCQTEKKPQLAYKYVTGESSSMTCESVDMKLFEEALLSFENDINQHYTPDQKTPSRAYSQYMRGNIRNNVKFKEIVSQHSIDIYNALKAEKDLWLVSENQTDLNFQHPLFKCIGENISNDDMRRTYNALLSTNSMSMRMIGNELQRKAFTMNKDKYAAVFSALITYYNNFHKLDFSNSEDEDRKN
ncbi:MAG: hypothetical protein AAF688_00565 [Bacteroidota bacterium]